MHILWIIKAFALVCQNLYLSFRQTWRLCLRTNWQRMSLSGPGCQLLKQIVQENENVDSLSEVRFGLCLLLLVNWNGNKYQCGKASYFKTQGNTLDQWPCTLRKCTSGWERWAFSALKGQWLPFLFILLSVVVWFYTCQDPEHPRTITPTSSKVCLYIEA